MSAAYSDIRRYDLPWQHLLAACRIILGKMGMDLVHDAEGYLIGHIRLPYGQGCDIITIYVREIGSVLITSENKNQDFDGHRNRERVIKFFSLLDDYNRQSSDLISELQTN